MKKPATKLDYPLLILLGIILILILAIIFVLVFRVITKQKAQEDATTSQLNFNLHGKAWVSYGDSITDGGFWQAAVAENFSLQHIDLGVGGSCVAGYAANAFWQEFRLQEIVAAAPEVITIMGGTNDFFSSFSLGSAEQMTAALADKDPATFLGAYAYLIERLQQELPDAAIVLITTPLNYTYFTDSPKNGVGLSIMDYANATAQLAEYYQLLLVDLRTIPYTAENFAPDFWDGVHPNLEGAARISAAVIATLDKAQASFPE